MIVNFKSKKEALNVIKKKFLKKTPIIISGGKTIKKILQNFKGKIRNKKVLISDERLVNVNSKLRNDYFYKKLIKKKILKKNQLINYRFDDYNKVELNKISYQIKKIKFEDSILSLGSKGHFASIFNFDDLKKDYYYINNSPKFPKKRVTVSLRKISESKNIFFIASRSEKKLEIQNFKKNKLINKINNKKITLFTF